MKNNVYYPNTMQDFIEPSNTGNIPNKDLEDSNRNIDIDTSSELNNFKVIGTGVGQELIERKIVFNPPKKDVVVELINVSKEVKIIDVEIGTNCAVVNGYIHNSIMYKTIKRPEDTKENNNSNNKDGKNEDSKENNSNENDSKKDDSKKDDSKKEQARPSCEIITVGSIAVDGVIRHTTVWIPFKSFIPINGARKGDRYEVLYSTINDEDCLLGQLPIYEEDKKGGLQGIDIIEDIKEQPFIEGIIDKNLIKISVVVKRG